MQNDFTENWSKLCQCANNSMVELTKLNVNTLSNIGINNTVENMTKSNKPEDMLAAQAKSVNAASLESVKYMQKAMEIGMQAMTEAGKIWAESCNKAAEKSCDMVKTGNTGKGKA